MWKGKQIVLQDLRPFDGFLRFSVWFLKPLCAKSGAGGLEKMSNFVEFRPAFPDLSWSYSQMDGIRCRVIGFGSFLLVYGPLLKERGNEVTSNFSRAFSPKACQRTRTLERTQMQGIMINIIYIKRPCMEGVRLIEIAVEPSLHGYVMGPLSPLGVMYWIIWDLADVMKDIDIAPPIQSRMYQELSNGMLLGLSSDFHALVLPLKGIFHRPPHAFPLFSSRRGSASTTA